MKYRYDTEIALTTDREEKRMTDETGGKDRISTFEYTHPGRENVTVSQKGAIRSIVQRQAG
jgi:hypothetical protein